MSEITNTAEIRENGVSEIGNGVAALEAKEKELLTSRLERKLASRLEQAIEERGRYAYMLRSIATGYAVAKGVSEQEAREKIGSIFHRETGMTLQGRLEEHRLENGLKVDGRSGRS